MERVEQLKVNRKVWYPVSLCLMIVLMACVSGQSGQAVPGQPLTGDNLHREQRPSPSPGITIPRQLLTSSPTRVPPPTTIPDTTTGAAPYGPPPSPTTEELQLTQELFSLMNHDRAVRGLYPFVWNPTLAGGARLHSWNMFHCGFSHTCPNGVNPSIRIANEGFAGFTDWGENIGLAGPSNPPWANIYGVQESMMNEGPTGSHFIHLTSKTLHRIGVGLYIDPHGWVWFTEDLVS